MITHGPSLQSSPAAALIVEPFLNVLADAIYNPLTGVTLGADDPEFGQVRALARGEAQVSTLEAACRQRLLAGGWLLEQPAGSLGRRYRLRIASLEATSHCNQACYFCPVSVSPRDNIVMDMAQYEAIVSQLAAHRDTLEGVFMMAYNEPLLDPHFLQRVRLLKQYGLKPAVNTNGTALTPERVNALMDMGGLAYLSVNLSTLDRQRYARDRGGDHLQQVLANLDYAGKLRLAPQMDIAVLGVDAGLIESDYHSIRRRFEGTYFHVRPFAANDRAGELAQGISASHSSAPLRGCDNFGSRPVEHVHIDAAGQCLLCCQDYSAQHVIGDLTRESLDAILGGERAASYRRQVYGLSPTPADFICRKCNFAIFGEPGCK